MSFWCFFSTFGVVLSAFNVNLGELMSSDYAVFSLKREVVRQIISQDTETLPVIEVRFLVNTKPYNCRQVSLGKLFVKPLVIVNREENSFCIEPVDRSLNKLIDSPETRTFFIRVQETVNAKQMRHLYKDHPTVLNPSKADEDIIVEFEQRIGRSVDEFIQAIKDIGLM